jgi:LysM domain
MPRPIQSSSTRQAERVQPVSNDPSLLRGPAARTRAFIEERLPAQSSAARSLEPASDTSLDETTVAPSTNDAERLAADHLRHLEEYRTRLGEQSPPEVSPQPTPPASTRALAPADLPPSAPPGLATNRWTSIGPLAVKTQPYGRTTAYSGRIADIAVAPGGKRLYVATANGGVWRSEDTGLTWQSLMDAFDLNPTAHRADSQACGAIALVAGEWSSQDVIYVGSGEAHGSLDAYYGVGPLVSHDGGLNWYREESEPSLVGMAFYALAVDPIDPTRVVAATTNGLYRRELGAGGAYIWRQKEVGEFSSVVVAHGDGRTVFYAAQRYAGLYQSEDGATWTALGTGFPSEGIGRIGLAVQPYNPNILYALATTSVSQFLPNGVLEKEAHHLHGLYRLDTREGAWEIVNGVPAKLFGTDLQRPGQGWYDLALAIAPNDVNRVYVGGATVLSDGIHDEPNGYGEWAAALYRCEITYSKRRKRYSAKSIFIGGPVHADVHALVFAPGDGDKLYVGCDGGLFYSTQPTADPEDPANNTGLFLPRNGGLDTMTMNYLGLHPSEEAVLFCGTQDNGGLRFGGDGLWHLSAGGDCGYCVINPRDPYHILTTYTYGSINRSRDGGTFTSYNQVAVPLVDNEGWSTLFYAPLVGAPYDPANPTSADLIAFGSDRVWISEHFGGYLWWEEGSPWQYETDWRSIPSGGRESDQLPSSVRSLTFATASKLYAGTTSGTVHRFARVAQGWEKTDLPAIPDTVGSITAIAVDGADGSGNAIYVTIGGYSEGARVWRFDGRQWQPRHGPANAPLQQLMNVQHNALVVDQWDPNHLFVGADIGIWHSGDGGATWEPFSRGLPDTAVLDLKQHPISGTIYAATHGRGVYEFTLYSLQAPVELYIRDHQLDWGRARSTPVAESRHPFDPLRTLVDADSPDIKFDLLNSDGDYAVSPPVLDFFRFGTELVETPVPAILYTHDTANLINRVYVQVHSHGGGLARHVRVLLLLGKWAETLPTLPAGYDQLFRNGIPIESSDWLTVGVCNLYNVRAEQPQIAFFQLTSDLLPTSDQLTSENRYLLAALVHSYADPFYAPSITTLDLQDRKVAGKMVTLAPYTGVLKPPVLPRRSDNPEIIDQYRVKSGDSLFAIAKHYYGDGNLWPALYRINKEVIGDNPRIIRPRVILQIPAL